MHPVRTFLNALARQALGQSLLAGLLAAPLHMADHAVRQPKPERSAPAQEALSTVLPLVPIGGPFQLDQAPLGELNAAPEAAIPDDWYNTVMANIASSEYHINYQEQVGTYQSPNRKQDLRITYHADGFELKSRVEEDAWKVELTLDRIGKPGHWMLPSDSATITTHEASLVADHGGFTMDYHNSEEGMRQNFVVRERPQGDGPLEVRLNYAGTLHAADKGGNAIAFSSLTSSDGSYTPTVWYKDLLVWDADGDTLEATASLDGSELVLSVNDMGAEYPITVDPLSTTANWTAESDQANAQFGACVASAGDVNRDGYSDVIIGAPLYDGGQTDEGRVYVFRGSATGLLATPYWTEESDQASAYFGTSVSTAGDVNGDGWSDVIIGAPNFDNGQTNEGRAFIYEGGLLGLPAVADWTAESNLASALYGTSVACAGDVNGDGLSDVIVGAPAYSSGADLGGRAYIYHGNGGTMSATASWITASAQAGADYGRSVASAGDVNGDGFSDVIVGASLFDNGQTNEGAAYVFYGSGSGTATTAAWTREGNQAVAQYGYGVSSAGDVNGDGFSDVIVGALYFDNGQTDEGRAFVYHGSAIGLAILPAWTAESDQASAYYGAVVACAGDVNGDGFADVIIGADSYDNGHTDEGRAYMYFGSSNGLLATADWTAEGDQTNAAFGWWVASAGDVNGDGYSDVLVSARDFDNGQTDEGRAFVYHGSAAGLTVAAAWTAEGNQTSAQFGCSASSAGDVNGDGYGDVIVGANWFDNGQPGEGSAFVYHGSPTGLSTAASWTAEGNQSAAHFGYSVSSAGDVNGDGYSDVIVGAYGFSNGLNYEGGAFVYHGSTTGLSATADWIAESNQVGAYFGLSVSSAGDVNGDGYSDVIVGALYFDNGEVDEGRAFVYQGSSNGLSATANSMVESNLSQAYFGSSVSNAGDVNGDGYSDVIISAIRYNNGHFQEGRAYVYHGGSAGLSATAAWTAEGNQIGADFGWSAASAGDVNGDGYSDVIVGARRMSSGQSGEGRAFVYHGGTAGLSATAAWTAEGNQIGANFGWSAASAGDVNGDGYSDVIVGAASFSNGHTDEGRAYLYLGSENGLLATADWTAEGNQDNAAFGWWVASAGDVNGDGYSDVIIGAPDLDNPETDEGRAFVYHGNNGTGRRHNLRLYNTDLTAPISQSNIANAQFGAGLYAKPFLGRGRVRLVWETRIQGQAFSSAGGTITNSVASTAQQVGYTLTAVGGTEVKNLVDKLTSTYPITATKVRARLRYSLVTALTGQVFGPWRYMPGYLDGHGTHNNIPLPVEMLWMEAACEKGTPTLSWATATERNSSHFLIERSGDADGWETVGQVQTAGHSQQVIEYAWRDDRPLSSSITYYRLRQVDLDGREEILPVQALNNCSTENAALSVYPNPTEGIVELRWSAQDGPHALHELRVLDMNGRTLRTVRVAVEAVSMMLDLSFLASGTYTLIGADANGVSTGKALVVRL